MKVIKILVLVLGVVWIVGAIAACGGGTKHASEPPATKLTANDIPDVLSPGIWPESGRLIATRQGNTITINTGWESYVPDDSVTVCSNTLGDLGAPGGTTANGDPLTVQVYGGAQNDTLLAWNVGGSGTKCHDLGNHS